MTNHPNRSKNAASLVLTVTTLHSVITVFTLNPGQHLATFGGSKSGLTAVKTASIVVRRESRDAGTVEDTEFDIHDPAVWQAVARWTNDTSGEVTATA